MGYAWIHVGDEADIRQGDVVKTFEANNPSYAVVLTADCDIAQRKTNNRMTVVRAVPIQEFVSKYWSAWELEKTYEKQIRSLLPFLNAKIAAMDLKLDFLLPGRLTQWTRESSPSEIFDLLELNEKKNSKELQALAVISIYASFADDLQDDDGLRALTRAFSALGRPVSDIRERVRDALLTSGGFQDYLVIPNLPGTKEDGLVVLMREVLTAPFEEFCKSEYQARVEDRPGSYVRIGRLADRVKYAVSQRIAFVFSRIGMEHAYEDSCGTLAELIALEAAP